MTNFTITVRGQVEISEPASAAPRALSPEDFETLLDAITDALYIQEVLGDITVGGSLRDGWMELSFSLDAANLAEGQKAGIVAYTTASVAAIAHLNSNRAGRRIADEAIEWLSASATAALVNA